MRLLRYLFVGVSLAIGAQAADLAAIKVIYLLPMSRGLDQYLAQKLALGGRFQVVTDPAKADAFFSDRIGASFEESLTDLLTPKAVVEKREESTYTRPPMQPLSRGKGNIFLIDRQTHSVIWSAFFSSKSSDSKELSRIAADLANNLSKADKQK